MHDHAGHDAVGWHFALLAASARPSRIASLNYRPVAIDLDDIRMPVSCAADRQVQNRQDV